MGPFVNLLSDRPIGVSRLRPRPSSLNNQIYSTPSRNFFIPMWGHSCKTCIVLPFARQANCFVLLNVDAPGYQTIQNWNPASNIDHAEGNLRVITGRTSMGPWTSRIQTSSWTYCKQVVMQQMMQKKSFHRIPWSRKHLVSHAKLFRMITMVGDDNND
jgi:hypothetical protein